MNAKTMAQIADRIADALLGSSVKSKASIRSTLTPFTRKGTPDEKRFVRGLLNDLRKMSSEEFWATYAKHRPSGGYRQVVFDALTGRKYPSWW